MILSDCRIERLDYDGGDKLVVSLELGLSQCSLTRQDLEILIAAFDSPSAFTEKNKTNLESDVYLELTKSDLRAQ